MQHRHKGSMVGCHYGPSTTGLVRSHLVCTDEPGSRVHCREAASERFQSVSVSLRPIISVGELVSAYQPSDAVTPVHAERRQSRSEASMRYAKQSREWVSHSDRDHAMRARSLPGIMCAGSTGSSTS